MIVLDVIRYVLLTKIMIDLTVDAVFRMLFYYLIKYDISSILAVGNNTYLKARFFAHLEYQLE